MNNKIYTIEEIREKIIPLAQKYNLKKVSLFGSYARGEATETSDLDFYIVDNQNSYDVEEWGYFRFYTELEDIFEKEIDVVIATTIKQNWDRWYTKLLYKNIKDDEVVLYDSRIYKGFEHFRSSN